MSLKDTHCSALETISTEIPSGQSITNTINVGGLRLFSVVIPDNWTTAPLTFQASYDGGVTWNDVWKNGAEYSITTAQGKDCGVDVQRFSSVQFLRIRSGTASAPVPQQDTRSIGLVIRGI